MQRVAILPAQRVRKISRKRSRSFEKVTQDDRSVTLSKRKEISSSTAASSSRLRRPASQMPVLMDTEKAMYEYVRFECELLAAKNELLILNALQNLTNLFRDLPAFSMMINKQRLVKIAHSKREADPKKWTIEIAKTFGKLMAVIRKGLLMKMTTTPFVVSSVSPSTSSMLSLPKHAITVKKRKLEGEKAQKSVDVKSAAMQLLKLSPKCGPLANPSSNVRAIASS